MKPFFIINENKVDYPTLILTLSFRISRTLRRNYIAFYGCLCYNV